MQLHLESLHALKHRMHKVFSSLRSLGVELQADNEHQGPLTDDVLRRASRGLTRVLRCSGTVVSEETARQLQALLQARGCMLLELHLDACRRTGGRADDADEAEAPAACLHGWELPQLLCSPGGSCPARHLRALRLDCCGLRGPIPDAVHLLPLQELSLASNHLDGPLPRGLGKCARLRHLSVRGNQLTGTIPHSLARCADHAPT